MSDQKTGLATELARLIRDAEELAPVIGCTARVNAAKLAGSPWAGVKLP